MSKEQNIHFKADQYRLTGTLHLPGAPNPPVIIGCHGLMADRSSPKQVFLAQACSRAGMAYFRFDHRGCGQSQGDFDRVTSLEARCEDLRQAMAAMARLSFLGPLIGLFGSSFGGTTVLKVATQTTVPRLLTFAAPVQSRSIRRSAAAHNARRPELDQKALDFDITADLGAVADILVAHGKADEIVPYSHAETIFRHVREPKRLILQPGGDHRMSDPVHQRSFAEQFIGWFMHNARAG